MVKQGFLNLSKEEQQRVLEAALDEFSQKDFEAASINQIIQNAGISKGSMYHYFHNKEDLYMYVLDIIMAEKAKFMTAALQKLDCPLQEMDFFDTMAVQLGMSVEFDRYMSVMVENAIMNGEIRAGLNKQFVLRVLRFVLLKFSDFYPEYAELLQRSDNQIMHEMEQLVDFLKHGLQGRLH